MPIALIVPDQYGLVVAAAAASVWVNVVNFSVSVKHRKLAKLPYPVPYASEEKAKADPAAYQFNCAQRAQSNFTDNYTPFIISLLIAGISFPVPSAAIGLLWSVFRIVYVLGYSNNGPQGRHAGSVHLLASLALNLMASYTAWQLVW